MSILSRLIDRAASRLIWLRSLWWNLAHRRHVDRALDDEVRSYIELLAAEYERGGMSAEEARRAALVAAGGIEPVKEATRDAWAGDAVANAGRELRYAVRSLRRSPGFLVIATATLAIGIGGATAVFTVIKGSLMRPLPAVTEPSRLVTIMISEKGKTFDEVSYPDYLDLRSRSTTLSGVAGFDGTSMSFGDAGARERVWVSFVTDDFFSVLGVRPAAGRLFDVSAANTNDADVAVLGHELWQRLFAGNPRIVGSTIHLDGKPFTVIGIAPPRFVGAMALHRMEVWIPAVSANGRPVGVLTGLDLRSRRLGAGIGRAVARLAPGKSIRDAEREIASLSASLATAHPETNGARTMQVVSGSGMTLEERATLSRVPRLLSIAVALLLLIACGNVAGLSLIRATARRRELATRLALGASRATLARQVALEGTVLAAGAAVLGIGIARLLVRSATIVHTAVAMPDVDLTMDNRVLALAVMAASLTAILVSLFPALQVVGVPTAAVLKDGGRAGRRQRGQRILVGAQVGSALVLLYASALVFTAFKRQLELHSAVDPGAITDVLLQTSSSNVSDTVQRLGFYREVLARAASEPGVATAAVTNTIPPFEWSGRSAVFRFGEEPAAGESGARERDSAPRANTVIVSPSFFDVMSIPILRGRPLATSDDERAPRVVVISQRLATVLWPGQDPVGRLIAWPRANGTPREPVRVVGVAADTRPMTNGGVPPLAMYLPFPQQPASNLALVVRARGKAPVSAASMQRIVAGVNGSVAVLGGRTLLDRLSAEAKPQQTASAWIGVFGAIALLLAAVGLYGVAAQTILQRRRELAIRSAVGATPVDIIALVLGDGMRLAMLGVLIGLIGSVAATRVLRASFAGIPRVDIWPGVAATVGLVVTMLIAVYVPARRGGRVNPAEALRAD